MPHRESNRLTPRFKGLSQLFGIVTILLGMTALTGWAIDNAFLKGVSPGWIAMATNTAICFILLGGVLLAGFSEKHRRPRQIASRMALGVVLMLAGSNLADYLFRIDLGIHEMFFHEPEGAVGTLQPNRMALTTAVCFILLSAALLVQDLSARWTAAAQSMALAAMFIAFLTFTGYFYGIAPHFYGWAYFAQMAFNTTWSFLAISLGVLFARPNQGFMRMVASDESSGMVIRRLFPLCTIVTVLLAYVVVGGISAGYFDHRFGTALLVILLIVLLSFNLWNVARSLYALEREREEVRDSLRQLQQQQQIFSEAVFGYVIALLDEDGHVVSWNAEAERITGYSTADILGKPIGLLDPAGRNENLYMQLSRQGSRGTLFEEEVRRQRKDGSHFTATIVITPITGQDNQLSGFSYILRDHTEIQELEQTSRESLLKLLQRDLSELSHDLRSPLYCIVTGSSMMLEMLPGELNAKQTEYLEMIHNNGQHLLGIINNMLDMAKVNAGKLNLQLKEIELEDFLHQNLEMVTPLAEEKRQELVIHIVHKLPETFLADPVRLKQVLNNLLTNAIKFSPEESRVELEVETSNNERLVFRIRDQGVGISPEEVERLFLPFEQGRGNVTTGVRGTGLGLPLAKRLTELHQGRLDVKSRPGAGSEFIVSLPMHAPVTNGNAA